MSAPLPEELAELLAAEREQGTQLEPLWEVAMPPQVDLGTLMAEMTALKQEVRTETRASRQLRDTLEHAVRERQERGAAEQAMVEELVRVREEALRERARTLIEVIDRLMRSLTSAQALATPKARFWGLLPARPDPVAQALVQGLELTLRQLRERLQDLGVTPVGELGQPFDPAVMEALDTVEGDRDDTIHQVIRCGYVLGERLLRTAQVVVVRSSDATPPQLPPAG
ncbi:MAG: nucleotide exchange factor GrpE [Myxococcota bacterium]